MTQYGCLSRRGVVAFASVVLSTSGAAHGAVQTFSMDWGPGGGSESIYIAINNFAGGPTSSGAAMPGWDLQIESSNSGNVLKFNFPPPPPGPVNPADPNPFYGLMRLPGVTTGPGASLSEGMLVQSTSSFADSGPVSFGGGAGQWRLNSVNIFGFRFRSPTSTTVHYGYGRLAIGGSPGQFRLIELSYQDASGAAIVVIPGPGVGVAMIAATALRGRLRRR